MDPHPAVSLLMKLLPISGTSGDEQAVLDVIVTTCLDAGLAESAITFDDAHKRAGFGATGNLIIQLPGAIDQPRRLLMAHVDTVPLCVGAKPIVEGDTITKTSPQTALGGDNRAGVAVILNSLLRIINEQPAHPPLTFLFAVQEEIGLVGAKFVDKTLLGPTELNFNFDGSYPNGIIRGATGDDHIDITVHGIASHAGSQPEFGVSAIAIAGLAIADLQQNGWLGKIEKPEGSGTSNLGSIGGGQATNVVTDHLTIRAEARSHNREFRQQIVDAIGAAFAAAAQQIANVDGRKGHVEFSSRNKYEAFCLEPDEPVVAVITAAMKKVGLEPFTRISNGGLDANWMTAHGLPTVTIGCGQQQIHTVDEHLHIPSFLQACDVAWELATGIEA